MTNQFGQPSNLLEFSETELQEKQARFAKLLDKARAIDAKGDDAKEEALKAYSEALEAVVEYNPNSLDVALVMNQMGLLLLSVGPMEAANKHYLSIFD